MSQKQTVVLNLEGELLDNHVLVGCNGDICQKNIFELPEKQKIVYRDVEKPVTIEKTEVVPVPDRTAVGSSFLAIMVAFFALYRTFRR